MENNPNHNDVTRKLSSAKFVAICKNIPPRTAMYAAANAVAIP